MEKIRFKSLARDRLTRRFPADYRGHFDKLSAAHTIRNQRGCFRCRGPSYSSGFFPVMGIRRVSPRT